jgi:hypothetical protein
MRRWIAALAFGLALLVTMAHAHHSISGVYESNRKVSVEGIVAEFQFVNPHPFVILTVKQANGSSERWQLEMDNRFELARIGMTSETLKSGDRISVTGNPSRTQSQRLYILRLDRPEDGFGYEQVGDSPRISAQSPSVPRP